MIDVRRFGAEDLAWALALLQERWGESRVVSRGQIHHADRLPGFVAWRGDERQGLATYRVSGGTCELVTLDALVRGEGIGSALLEAVVQEARRAACARLWCITTNDNLQALRFYQRRGFVLAALRREALDLSRRLKPCIPAVGRNGIPLRDELELEHPL